MVEELAEPVEKVGHVVRSLEGLSKTIKRLYTWGAIWNKFKAYGVLGKDNVRTLVRSSVTPI